MEIRYSCPLGHKCESMVSEGVMDRCRWYKHLQGRNPNTGEMQDEWDCSIGWMPLLQTETAMTNRGQTSVLEQMRNVAMGKSGLREVTVEEAKSLLSNDSDKA